MSGIMAFAGAAAVPRDIERTRQTRRSAVVMGGRVSGKRIAVSGATGFVGKNLVRALADEGAEEILVLARNVPKARSALEFGRRAYRERYKFVSFDALRDRGGEDERLAQRLAECDAVVNLAGLPIADGRWTPERKRQILESRVRGTRRIVNALKQQDPRTTTTLISASAIGYYGTSQTETFIESSPPGSDFLADVTVAWEAEAARAARELDLRTVVLRLGLVMGKEGGALAKLVPAFNAFVGGPLGSGRQWVSWIHMDDVINIMIEALASPDYSGVYNVTAPQPASFSQVCNELGEILNRPSWLPVPGMVLQAALGDASNLVLQGQRVLPEALVSQGYEFLYPELRGAFRRTFRSAPSKVPR